MEKLPEISVVLAIYNAENFIEEALASLCGQTYGDFEVICVDDGSKDGTGALIQKIAEKDVRIKYVYQENAGAGAARNHGIEQALGKYIIFLDPDDVFCPELLDKLHATIVEYDADVAICDANAFTVQNGEYKEWKYYTSKFPTGVYTRKEMMPRIYKVPGSVAWNKLFKRELILETGLKFQQIPHTNDLFFVRSVILNCKKICFINEALVKYRIGYGGSLQDSKYLRWQFCYEAWEKLYDYAADSGILDKKGMRSLQGFLFINFLYVAESFSNHTEVLEEFLMYGKKRCWKKWGLDRLDTSILASRVIRMKYWAYNRGSVKNLTLAVGKRKMTRTKSRKQVVANMPYYLALIGAGLRGDT